MSMGLDQGIVAPEEPLTPPVSPDVQAVMDEWSPLMQSLRQTIFEVAAATEAGPLTETLKWGQPAYLTEVTRSGTTLRLGYVPGEALPLRLYVHCQTNLVDRYRDRFGDVLRFEGNRAICLPETAEAVTNAPLRHCIAMALTYHRDKKAAG